MWKLKISEGGQFVKTCRAYLGRETWEFDERLGSSDERAAVERAREEFAAHRFDKTQSSDFLARMQIAKENNFNIMSKKSKLENEDGSEQNVLAALQNAVDYLSAIQAKSGHWPGDLPGPLFMTTNLIITLYITESVNFLSPEHQKELRRYMYNTQNKDGGWGLQAGCQSCMMSTALCYISLRLLGDDTDNEKLYEGQRWIHDHGGVTMIPSWGKFWVAVLGAYEWSGVHPLPPELFTVPSFLPIHPGKFYIHVRMIYSAMSYLYAKRFVGPMTKTIISLQKELYIRPYDKIDWNLARKSCYEGDRIVPHMRFRDYFNEFLYKLYEPFFAYWPFSLWRKGALKFIENHMKYEDENSRYIWVSALQKSLFMLSSWVRDRNSEEFKCHLARVPDYLWVGEDGMKFKCCSSQLWDTAFAVQAILACDFAKEVGNTLRKAHDFIKDSQILENPSGNFRGHFRHMTKGGWSFAIVDQAWPVSDCTAEAIKALLLLSDISADIVGEHLESERLYLGVNFLLSLQNTNGGFSTWELSRSYPWAEVFNTSEIFEGIMQDYPCVECTSASIQALVIFKKRYPKHRRREIEKCIESAIKYIESTQNDDGSWYGSFGLCYTYGTWFGIEGLLAIGRTYENGKSIRKACNFLLSKQLNDGGWGESYQSSYKKEYINLEGNKSNLVNTAWAMLALIKAGQFERDPNPVHCAAKYIGCMQLENGDFPQQEYINLEGNKSNLVNTAWAMLALIKAGQFERDPNPVHCAAKYIGCMQLENGDFPQQEMRGSYFKYGLMNYMMYRNIFPIWFLAEYHKKVKYSPKVTNVLPICWK